MTIHLQNNYHHMGSGRVVQGVCVWWPIVYTQVCDNFTLLQFQQSLAIGSGSSEGLTHPSSVHNKRCNQRCQNHTSHHPRSCADYVLFAT